MSDRFDRAGISSAEATELRLFLADLRKREKSILHPRPAPQAITDAVSRRLRRLEREATQ